MKNLFKSSIVGALILTFLILMYSLLFLCDYVSVVSFFQSLLGLVKIIPILLLFSYMISTVYSFLIANFLYRYSIKNLVHERTITNLSFYLGLLVGVVLSTINYGYTHSLAKSFFIVIGIVLISIGNTLCFLVLSEIIIIKEKENGTIQRQGVE